MKLVAATDKLVVIDLEASKRTPAEQIRNYVDMGLSECCTPSILRIFPDYVEVETEGFNSRGSMRKKRKRIWFRDMLIMNDALYRIMCLENRGRVGRLSRKAHNLELGGSNPSLCTNAEEKK